MQDIISQYIQQQMEAARLEQQRLHDIVILERQKQDAERKSKSLTNTILALGVLGIEAGESDLQFNEDYGYHLVFNNVCIVLPLSYGVNQLEERVNLPFRNLEFNLRVSRIIPDGYRDEEGELPRGFRYQDYFRDFPIVARGDHNAPYKVAVARIIPEIFDAIRIVEENFQRDLALYNADSGTPVERTPVVKSPVPKYNYTGDSREEILSKLLSDIANPPKGECAFCGRRAVNPIDKYCMRCGADQEGA
jgi:hypothetical protein